MNDELYHYGILGMKWGIRKKKKDAVKSARAQRKANRAAIREKAKKQRAERLKMMLIEDQAREEAEEYINNLLYKKAENDPMVQKYGNLDDFIQDHWDDDLYRKLINQNIARIKKERGM